MTPKLDVNDAGFATNANDLLLQQLVTLRSTKRALGLLNTSLRLNMRYELFTDTYKPVHSGGNGAYLVWLATLPNFWTLRVNGGPTIPSYNSRETRDGALLETPLGYNYGFEVKTDPRKSVVVDLALDG